MAFFKIVLSCRCLIFKALKDSLLALFILVSTFVLSQNDFTDTIYYRSGLIKTCKIEKIEGEILFYSYKNPRGNIKSSQQDITRMRYYVQYEDGVKVYDSRGSDQFNNRDVMYSPRVGHNDTIYYKSGMVKPCTINDFDTYNIYYQYKNSKGQEKSSNARLKIIKHFVRYDTNGVKLYDSRSTSGIIASSGIHADQLIHNDTIYFVSENPLACFITRYDMDDVFYNYFNFEGDLEHTSKNTMHIKRFVIYDENDSLIHDSGDIEKISYKADKDSVLVAPHILSINPFSLGALALNVQCSYRFGSNMEYGIRFNGRYLSPILFAVPIGTAGVGFIFYPVNNQRYTFSIGLNAQTIFTPVDFGFGFPISIGFMRYLREKISFTGNLGIGLGYSPDSGTVGVMPLLHFGIGFQLGEKVLINTKPKNIDE